MGVTTILLLIVGLVALVAGAEGLVRGAASLAARTGMSSVVIGLTVVAFGTSAPELAVSISDALSGSLFVAQRIVRLDVPIMVAVSVLVLVFALNEHLGRIDGLVLVGLLSAYIVWTVITATRGSSPDTVAVAEYDEAFDP